MIEIAELFDLHKIGYMVCWCAVLPEWSWKECRIWFQQRQQKGAAQREVADLLLLSVACFDVSSHLRSRRQHCRALQSREGFVKPLRFRWAAHSGGWNKYQSLVSRLLHKEPISIHYLFFCLKFSCLTLLPSSDPKVYQRFSVIRTRPPEHPRLAVRLTKHLVPFLSTFGWPRCSSRLGGGWWGLVEAGTLCLDLAGLMLIISDYCLPFVCLILLWIIDWIETTSPRRQYKWWLLGSIISKWSHFISFQKGTFSHRWHEKLRYGCICLRE